MFPHFAAPPPRSAWPRDLLVKIQQVICSESFKPKSPEFSFKLDKESAQKNWEVFEKYNLDIQKAIEGQSHSPMKYGSEFREVSVLEPLLKHHPNWSKLRAILTRGSSWVLEELDEEKRKSDVQDAIEFGNHKGAAEQPEKLKELILKDVEYGYAMVIPLEHVARIPGACIAPMNISPQYSINEYGEIIPKDRLTHDQSWKWGSGTSVNSRVKEETLSPCVFAHALRRFINKVVAMRNRYPEARIFCSKIDYKSAFRRMHLNWETATKAITQLPDDGLALMYLRLTFGGKPCPAEWGNLSETVCDLANAIVQTPDWDPETLFNPQSLELPPAKPLPDEVPLAKGRELVVDVPIDDKGCSDVFIDDTFAIVADLPGSDNIKRLKRAILLALHAVARPLAKNEPIPRHEMAARNKFIAEAAAEEVKMVLGWQINFRTLMISLPKNKFIAWSEAIRLYLDKKVATAKQLETDIGRMVHISNS